MRGSYLGPYPNREEAFDAVSKGGEITVEDLRKDSIVINGEAIVLKKGVGNRLWSAVDTQFRFTAIKADFSSKPSTETFNRLFGPMKAVLWKDECIIVQIPTGIPFWMSPEGMKTGCLIALISRSAGKPFACYAYGTVETDRLFFDWFSD